VAKPELGIKRQCLNCGTKFFDLCRDPIVCPKCGTVFQVTSAVRAAPRAAAEDESEPDTGTVELVSLDEAEAAEEKATAAVGDDIEIDDDDDTAAETFLEEEEGESDDVTGLIDGDIEDDEEA
jgi:uncharacterized protein (TIGR02300 family)